MAETCRKAATDAAKRQEVQGQREAALRAELRGAKAELEEAKKQLAAENSLPLAALALLKPCKSLLESTGCLLQWSSSGNAILQMCLGLRVGSQESCAGQATMAGGLSAAHEGYGHSIHLCIYALLCFTYCLASLIPFGQRSCKLHYQSENQSENPCWQFQRLFRSSEWIHIAIAQIGRGCIVALR